MLVVDWKPGKIGKSSKLSSRAGPGHTGTPEPESEQIPLFHSYQPSPVSSRQSSHWNRRSAFLEGQLRKRNGVQGVKKAKETSLRAVGECVPECKSPLGGKAYRNMSQVGMMEAKLGRHTAVSLGSSSQTCPHIPGQETSFCLCSVVGCQKSHLLSSA